MPPPVVGGLKPLIKLFGSACSRVSGKAKSGLDEGLFGLLLGSSPPPAGISLSCPPLKDFDIKVYQSSSTIRSKL